jgi:hypothetical protein
LTKVTENYPPNSTPPKAEQPVAHEEEQPASEPAEDPGYLAETGEAAGEDGSLVPIIGGLPAVEGSAATCRDLKGRQRLAGTFSSRRQADQAWQRAEGKVAQGYLGDPSRGHQTFRDYLENTWLPNHEIEASTRQSYTYALRIRILPEFGEMQMMDILPEHVREWACMKAGGVSPPPIPCAKTTAATGD